MFSLCAFSGYSVTTINDGSTLYFVAGAPRSNHSGQVIIYTVSAQKKSDIIDSARGKQVPDIKMMLMMSLSCTHVLSSSVNSWKLLSQIGSYFGSVLCSLDVDRDGVTDLLLVGAPMFMSELKREEGRVYLFSITRVTESKWSPLYCNRS